MDVYDLQRGWEKYLRWETSQTANAAGIMPVANAPKPPTVGALMSKGYRVKFTGNTKKTTILRFILAKSVYEEVDEADVAAIEELLMTLLDKSAAEADFKVKWLDWLNTSVAFCKQAFRGRKFPRKISSGVLAQYNDLVPFLPSKQVYYRMKPEIGRSFRILPENPHKISPPKPQKRVVGVGYRDKGTSRNEAEDGSPSWKELSKAYDGHLDRVRKLQTLENKARKLRAADLELTTRVNFGIQKLERSTTIHQLKAALRVTMTGVNKSESEMITKAKGQELKELRKLLSELDNKLPKI